MRARVCPTPTPSSPPPPVRVALRWTGPLLPVSPGLGVSRDPGSPLRESRGFTLKIYSPYSKPRPVLISQGHIGLMTGGGSISIRSPVSVSALWETKRGKYSQSASKRPSVLTDWVGRHCLGTSVR